MYTNVPVRGAGARGRLQILETTSSTKVCPRRGGPVTLAWLREESKCVTVHFGKQTKEKMGEEQQQIKFYDKGVKRT